MWVFSRFYQKIGPFGHGGNRATEVCNWSNIIISKLREDFGSAWLRRTDWLRLHGVDDESYGHFICIWIIMNTLFCKNRCIYISLSILYLYIHGFLSIYCISKIVNPNKQCQKKLFCIVSQNLPLSLCFAPYNHRWSRGRCTAPRFEVWCWPCCRRRRRPLEPAFRKKCGHWKKW